MPEPREARELELLLWHSGELSSVAEEALRRTLDDDDRRFLALLEEQVVQHQRIDEVPLPSPRSLKVSQEPTAVTSHLSRHSVYGSERDSARGVSAPRSLPKLASLVAACLLLSVSLLLVFRDSSPTALPLPTAQAPSTQEQLMPATGTQLAKDRPQRSASKYRRKLAALKSQRRQLRKLNLSLRNARQGS